jgi:3-oxoacyl-[acyl-carrier protein] reductase
MSRLKGKVAVVTGASKGIGAAIAEKLAAEGAAVAVNYSSSKPQAEAVVARIQAKGGKAVAIQGDISKSADVERVFAEAHKALGKLDILINNAGVYEFRPLEQIDEAHIRKIFDLNVTGLLLATQAGAKRMNDGGSIVNISSIASITPPPGSAVYSGTKGAVDVINRVLAQELAPRQIRVNVLSPGYVVTEGTQAMNGEDKAFENLAVSHTPLARAGQPDDIAKVAAFLASDESAWMTGEILPVGGGIRL